jgi:hypothetical protein
MICQEQRLYPRKGCCLPMDTCEKGPVSALFIYWFWRACRPAPNNGVAMKYLFGILSVSLLFAAGCGAGAPGGSGVKPDGAAQPNVARDTRLHQQVARLEMRLLEKEAQLEDLQARLDDARREVVRNMAKTQSLATRAEAASGIAEAEIALRSLRATGAAPEVPEVSQLMRLSTAEFDKQNYGGALYLANQAKSAAVAGGQLASVEHGTLRAGEVRFALPLRLQTAGRANVRGGPGSSFAVAFTLPAGAALTGHSYSDQWVRVTDEAGRLGWIYQSLIARRP